MLVKTAGKLGEVRQTIAPLKAQIRRILVKPVDDVGLEAREDLVQLMLGLCVIEKRLADSRGPSSSPTSRKGEQPDFGDSKNQQPDLIFLH